MTEMPEDVMPLRSPVKEEDDDDDIVMSDEDDFGNPLEELLVTDDGDNIANGLVKAIDRVSRLLDTQNKIFVKLYTVLSKISEKA